MNDSKKNHVPYGLITDLRDQLTAYEQFGCINMRAITFSFVDQSSSRGREKFGENIPTSPEVIGMHMLNFKRNFTFSSSFFWGTPVPVWVCVSKSSAISSAYKNLRAHQPVRAEI